MSFRGDDQRHYGHVPPVQYPVSNQNQPPPPPQQQPQLQQQQYHQQPYQQYSQQQYSQDQYGQQQYSQEQYSQEQYSQQEYSQQEYSQQHYQDQQYEQQPTQQQQPSAHHQYPQRRQSFNTGDDTAYFDQGQGYPQSATAARGEEELFLTSPATGPSNASLPPLPAKPTAYGGPAATSSASSPYQQQAYQILPSPSTYNPQAFARSQSQSLPYHPHPSASLASPTVPSFSSFQSQQQSYATPAAYNPAAYAATNTTSPQRTTSYAGYATNTAYQQQQQSYAAPAAQSPLQTASSPFAQQQASPAVFNHTVQPSPIASSPHTYVQQQKQQQQPQQYQPASYYTPTTPATTAAAAATAASSSDYAASQPSTGAGGGGGGGGGSYFALPNANSAYSSDSVAPPPTPPMASTSTSPYTVPSTTTSQAPYAAHSHVTATSSSNQSSPAAEPYSFASRVSRSTSNASSMSSQPVHTPSPASGLLQRHPTNAPLPSRPPMEDVLEEDDFWDPAQPAGHGGGAGGAPLGHADHEYVTQDSLIHDIEADLGIGNSSSTAAAPHTTGHGPATNGDGSTLYLPTPGNGELSDSDYFPQGSRASSTHPSTGWSSSASHLGRASSTASTASSSRQAAIQAPTSYRWEEDSDPEGAFGVYVMQQADIDDQRFSVSSNPVASRSTSVVSTSGSGLGHSSGGGGQHLWASASPSPRPTTSASVALPEEPHSSDSDFVGMDIGLFSGGYAGSLAYGDQVGSGPSAGHLPPPTSSTPRPSESDGQYRPFLDANMDYGGTGGLQAPTIHRLSYDDGDEHISVHSGHSGSESPQKEDYLDMPDMFYHPGLSSRPLPALPSPGATSDLGPASISASASSNSLLSASQQSVAASRLPYRQHSYSLSADSRAQGSGYYSQQPGQQQPYQQQLQHQQYQEHPEQAYPSHLQQQQQQHLQSQVERSTSMSTYSNTPHVQLPGRSLTDAAEERRRVQKLQGTHGGNLSHSSGSYGSGTPSVPEGYDAITLPSGRRRKFVPSKLDTADLDSCKQPWALSSLASWIRGLADGEPDLKRKTIEEGLVVLFTAKVPMMNVADAETLAAMVADSMLAAGILIPEEEWVKFGPGEMSGVLWQLTGSGCYSSRLHMHEVGGRCYSHYCTRTLKKANLDELMAEESAKKEDWVTFYKITKEMMESKPRKEVERQNVLHEIVTSEEEFNSQLDVLRVLFMNQLKNWQPAIFTPARLDKFLNTVFGKVLTMQATNRDHLLAQLKYRQNEQGPWIVGFSDIFREWIRKAKDVFTAYSTAYPVASFTMRKEAGRNVAFRQFLENVRNHPRCNRLGWDTFLRAPIARLQRYSLLLSTVLKNTLQESEEKANLVKAIAEIVAVTKECDRLVDEMGKEVSLQELQNQLVFRNPQIRLNLDHLGRELLMQGDLQRMGSKGVRWVDTHALLFDHYFILAKAVSSKDGRTDKKYDVSKEPIPMPLLLLESMNDDPVSKQKGLTAPLARTTTAAAPDTRLSKVASNGASGRPELEHTATSSSVTSITRLASAGGAAGEEGKILYPFRVKHLGHETYTLFATTPQSRQEWCDKIIEAKTRHARALLEQNAEPFRLRVLADSSFAYDSASAPSKHSGVSIRGTPLDRSIREMEQVFGPGRGPAPVCRATVNCSAGFSAFGKSIVAIGTDYGVYISDASNPRGWSRTVQATKVTQIAVLEEFSVCLVLADKSLVAYPLDAVAPVSNFPAPSSDSQRRAPQRLAKDVSFFATARMKERTLVFYKRKEGMHNTFKVLEPVLHKAAEKKSRLFGGSRRGASGSGGATATRTESFRDFDEFYLPTECYSLNLFQTYVAVSTAKGIVMLTLDRKQTMAVPQDLSSPETANIAARIRDQRPLGMFRLTSNDFLLAYEDCAVYVDKHGEVSRTLIMEYSGKQKKAKAATMFGQYLLLFNEDYVEVRNAGNGRLRQIIAGSDVRCLDYGFRGPTGGDNASAMALPPGTDAGGNAMAAMGAGLSGLPPGNIENSKGTVKISMTHPEQAGMQVVLELLLNDGHSETAA